MTVNRGKYRSREMTMICHRCRFDQSPEATSTVIRGILATEVIPMARKRAKLGSGARFKALKRKLAGRKGVRNAGALSAYIGRKKFGAKRYAKLSARGRRKKK